MSKPQGLRLNLFRLGVNRASSRIPEKSPGRRSFLTNRRRRSLNLFVLLIISPMRSLRGLHRLATSKVHPAGPVFSAPPSIANDPARNFFPLSSSVKPPRPVLMLKGATDTIGLEVTSSLERVFHAANVPIKFVNPIVNLCIDGGLTDEVINLFTETKVAIKGPYFTPVGAHNVSLNIQLRKAFDLFANVVHAHNIPGVTTRHSNVDVVIIRENTEGEYSGLEHSAVPGVVESLKIITEEKSMRIAEYAFQYAMANQRRKVTAVHKANIMKSADGLFLECCTNVASKYPFIEFESMIVDNTCMQMASRPQQFDVMILPNLYGNIVTNIATGLVGGPGLIAGANIGLSGAIFEQGSRHSARSLAGQGIANPTATIMAGVLMLRYLKLESHADFISDALLDVFASTNLRTKDVAFDGMEPVSTETFTNAIIERLDTRP